MTMDVVRLQCFSSKIDFIFPTALAFASVFAGFIAAVHFGNALSVTRNLVAAAKRVPISAVNSGFYVSFKRENAYLRLIGAAALSLLLATPAMAMQHRYHRHYGYFFSQSSQLLQRLRPQKHLQQSLKATRPRNRPCCLTLRSYENEATTTKAANASHLCTITESILRFSFVEKQDEGGEARSPRHSVQPTEK